MEANDMARWTANDVAQQAGRFAVITGTGGLGFETALVLAQHGAEVILAGRNEAKGRDATRKILALAPEASVRFQLLDLADLASVTTFSDRLLAENRPIDLLVNNAGVMTPPSRRTTVDGFELQFGTNYLGHFALTARLLPLLRRGRSTRVVEVSSGAHRLGGAIHFDDLQWERSYKPWGAYAQSKLAMLMFALELQRRSDAAGWGLMSNAAHPGYARTELIANGPGADALMTRIGNMVVRPFLSQSAADGALPVLFAATSPDAKGGGYYGPAGPFELIGAPGPAVIGAHAKDLAVAKKLWELSEELTGTQWQVGTAFHDSSRKGA
jgi:NAD(P)-dependent dehydrogenase (short-subunit alcohol dehydrogenase family)